jgi:inward rectifier potassium channel
MSFLAVMTGLVFARFSRPKARFVFARHPVVTMLNGRPTLMIQIANAHTISQATARLWLFRLERTKEREQLRRYYEELFREGHPMFSLSWTLVHIIDETSAFRDNARQIYSRDDIRWQHRYRDITSLLERGRVLLDYTKFHEVDPENVTAAALNYRRRRQH